jgi:hypothetical protein
MIDEKKVCGTSQHSHKGKEYLPTTFESLMESFGTKLQRKTLFEDFMETHNSIEKLTQDRHSTNNDIVNICASTGNKMKKLIEMTSAKPS